MSELETEYPYVFPFLDGKNHACDSSNWLLCGQDFGDDPYQDSDVSYGDLNYWDIDCPDCVRTAKSQYNEVVGPNRE